MRGIHKWNICLCMSLGWATHHLAYAVQPGGGHIGKQEWSKCLHLHVWCSRISWKWECYTGTLYFGKHEFIFKIDGNVSFHKRLESRPELLVYFYAPDESISGKFLFFSSFLLRGDMLLNQLPWKPYNKRQVISKLEMLSLRRNTVKG